jgi:uncharacterized RDD family membrane protein YckC
MTNPSAARLTTPMQPDLFSYAPQGKVVRMRMTFGTPNAQPRQSAHRAAPPEEDNAAGRVAAEDPLFARGRSVSRRRYSSSQSEFDFAPPTHRPFSNELTPVYGLSAAPLRVRFYSLLIDALVVAVLSIMFAAAVFVAFRASGEKIDPSDLLVVPWYLLAAIPVVLSLGYKALWAVFQHPTLGLQSFGLDVISMDGHRPTIGQRMVRVFAGWLTIGGMVGALWAVVSQERYSMQDMISQTFLTSRSE